MASSFWYENFYFDNESSLNHNVYIIDFNTSDILKQIGGSHIINLERETSYNNQSLYKEKERSSDNIILQLVKIDRTAWTINDILDVNGWLFKEKFCKFQPMEFFNENYNVVYYLKAVDMKKHFNHQLEGYIEITFQTYDGFVYIVPTTPTIIHSNETKTVKNLSNIGKKYLPKIKVTNLGDQYSDILIRNTTNGNTLTLGGLYKDEVVIIDCAIGSVLNTDNTNRFSVLQDYEFIGLEKGNNIIQLLGNADIEFICEYPVVL